MKILLISRLAEYVYPSYTKAEAVNQEVYWLAEALKEKGNQVSVVCREGSILPPVTLTDAPGIFVKTGNEQAGFGEYKDKLPEYEGIADFSDEKWSTTLKEEKKLNIVYVCHPAQGYFKGPPLRYPCFVGVSNSHAEALSLQLGIPVKSLPFGLPQLTKDAPEKKDFLLFFGRVVKERGAHEFVALCGKKRYPAVIAGDDIHVDQAFVESILQKCDGKLIKYYGTVSEEVKNNLLLEAKALVIPYLQDSDAHCLLTIKRALRWGTPVYTTRKGSTHEVGCTGYYSPNEMYDAPLAEGGTVAASNSYSIAETSSKLEDLLKESSTDPW